MHVSLIQRQLAVLRLSQLAPSPLVPCVEVAVPVSPSAASVLASELVSCLAVLALPLTVPGLTLQVFFQDPQLRSMSRTVLASQGLKTSRHALQLAALASALQRIDPPALV